MSMNNNVVNGIFLTPGGRVGSVDNGFFIHAVVSRHVETVTLITRAE